LTLPRHINVQTQGHKEHEEVFSKGKDPESFDYAQTLVASKPFSTLSTSLLVDNFLPFLQWKKMHNIAPNRRKCKS